MIENFKSATDQATKAVKHASNWTASTPCNEWNLRTLINHMVSELRWIPPILEGKTITDVGDRLDGDLLGSDPKAAWQDAIKDALKAVKRPGALDLTVHLSFGDTSAVDYIEQVTVDLIVHSWDVAKAVGASDQLDQKLVDLAWNFCKDMDMNDWRIKSLEPAPGADLQAKLLARFGRQASWQAPN